MRFKNKVTLITGGNFGIGFGIAKKFSEEGSKIAIVARNVKKAESAIKYLKEKGCEAKFFKTDVSIEKNVKKMIEQVVNDFGKLNFVINNAGCGSQHCGINPSDPPSKRWKILTIFGKI